MLIAGKGIAIQNDKKSIPFHNKQKAITTKIEDTR